MLERSNGYNIALSEMNLPWCFKKIHIQRLFFHLLFFVGSIIVCFPKTSSRKLATWFHWSLFPFDAGVNTRVDIYLCLSCTLDVEKHFHLTDNYQFYCSSFLPSFITSWFWWFQQARILNQYVWNLLLFWFASIYQVKQRFANTTSILDKKLSQHIFWPEQ